MKLLFICTSNRLRSPTAQTLFAKRDGVEARSAGTDQDASVVVDADLIAWADMIFVMENAHRNKVRKKFKNALGNKNIITLNIPDEYERDDPDLIRLLEARVGPWLSRR